MSSLLVVDGHSAIFALPSLKEEHARNARRSRATLVDWLNRYQGASGESVVVVFDGRGGERTAEGGSASEALVLYSPAGATADAVIEGLVAKQAPKRRVTVASNDRLVLEAAMASGGEAVSITGLEELVERALARFRGRWDVR